MPYEWKTEPDGIVLVSTGPGKPLEPISLDGPDRSTKMTMTWLPLASEYAKRSGVPVQLVLGTIYSESGGIPTVTNFCCDGLMALARDVWRPACKLAPGALRDPEVNICVGSEVLRQALEMTEGDIPTAVSIYNAGPSKDGGAKQNKSSPWGMVEDQPEPWKSHIEKVVRASNFFAGELGAIVPEPNSRPPSLATSTSPNLFPRIAVAVVAVVVGFRLVRR